MDMASIITLAVGAPGALLTLGCLFYSVRAARAGERTVKQNDLILTRRTPADAPIIHVTPVWSGELVQIEFPAKWVPPGPPWLIESVVALEPLKALARRSAEGRPAPGASTEILAYSGLLLGGGMRPFAFWAEWADPHNASPAKFEVTFRRIDGFAYPMTVTAPAPRL